MLDHPLMLQDAGSPGPQVVKVSRCGAEPPAELPLLGFAPDITPRTASLKGTPNHSRESVEVLGGSLVFPDSVDRSSKFGGADLCSAVFVKNFENVLPELHRFLICFKVKKRMRCPVYTHLPLGCAGWCWHD